MVDEFINTFDALMYSMSIYVYLNLQLALLFDNRLDITVNPGTQVEVCKRSNPPCSLSQKVLEAQNTLRSVWMTPSDLVDLQVNFAN